MVKNKYRKITSSALLENVSFFSTLFFLFFYNLMKTGQGNSPLKTFSWSIDLMQDMTNIRE